MSEIVNAIKQICEEKGLSYEAVIATIESALAAAYRKDYGEKNQNIKVEFNPETSETKVYDLKTVVEDLPVEPELAEGAEPAAASAGDSQLRQGFDGQVVEPRPSTLTEEQEAELHRFNPKTEIQLSEAKALKKKYKIGDEIRTDLPSYAEYGRMAAQTAKQVIIQRLREAERDMVLSEFKDKEKEVITGVVQRREGRVVLVDLGRSTGIILPEDQIKNERYTTGNRLKVYVREVNSTARGPEILLSRTSEEILRKVFYLEIPEISNGLIEIKAVAREAGARSKVAVSATSENIDPIGSCVGQRGARIQTIIREIGGEKIDIIEYSDDLKQFIANALSPAKIESVELNEQDHKATVKVAADQLSLAIGKSGQNVRLAAHLTNWKIDIVGSSEIGVVKISSDELENAEDNAEGKNAEENAEGKETAEKDAEGKENAEKNAESSSALSDVEIIGEKKTEIDEEVIEKEKATEDKGKKTRKPRKKSSSAEATEDKKGEVEEVPAVEPGVAEEEKAD
jgi:N utilization substance protein A